MKKIVAAILAVPFAIGFCTIGHKGKEPSTDHLSGKYSFVQSTMGQAEEPYTVKNLGEFSLTFYTPYEEGGKWGYQTATGATSKHLKTCAVDPKIIPLGSVIQITGNNGQTLVLKCVDIGGDIKGNKIDVFYDGSQSAAYNWIEDFGTIHNVYLLEE